MNMNIFYYFINVAICNENIDCNFIYDITTTIIFFWSFSNDILFAWILLAMRTKATFESVMWPIEKDSQGYK